MHETPSTYVAPTHEPVLPKVKKQKNISIKSINTQTTWRLESSDDVKKYITELEKKLMDQIEEDIIVNVEF